MPWWSQNGDAWQWSPRTRNTGSMVVQYLQTWWCWGRQNPFRHTTLVLTGTRPGRAGRRSCHQRIVHKWTFVSCSEISNICPHHQLLSRFKSMSWGQLQGGCNLCVQISLKSMCTCSPDRIEGKHHGTFNMACVQPEKAHQKKCGLLSNCRQHRRSPEELRTTSKGAFQLVSEIRASRPQQMNSEPSWTSINLKCSLGMWITPWTHFVKSKPIWGVNGASSANNISWQSLMHTLERAEISFHCRPGLECKPVNKPQQRDAHGSHSFPKSTSSSSAMAETQEATQQTKRQRAATERSEPL